MRKIEYDGFSAVVFTLAIGGAKIFLPIPWWVVFLPIYGPIFILLAYMIFWGMVEAFKR
jgi:hypothetical protein